MGACMTKAQKDAIIVAYMLIMMADIAHAVVLCFEQNQDGNIIIEYIPQKYIL